MKFIINSNRIIAALIKNASSRHILFFPKFEFYAPKFLVDELEKYTDEIQKKAKITSNQFEKIYTDALNKVHVIPFIDYREKIAEAEKIMAKIDIKDVAFIATGLALKIENIWTEDTHFTKQKVMKVYSTQDLIQLLKKFEE
jgi:predicted nucleic acid-binding protein